MERFLVPQYIDEEAKIIGPITARQFVELLVGAGFSFIAWKLIYNFWARISVIIVIMGIFGILAFIKINGRPFHYFLLNIAQTFKKPRLRIWRKAEELQDWVKFEAEKAKPKIATKEALKASRLSDISLIVDTGGAYKGAEEDEGFTLNNNLDK